MSDCEPPWPRRAWKSRLLHDWSVWTLRRSSVGWADVCRTQDTGGRYVTFLANPSTTYGQMSPWAHRARITRPRSSLRTPIARTRRPNCGQECLTALRTNIDLLGYAMLFFPEQHPRLAQIINDKCADGLRVRIALADPDGAEVKARDALEGLGGTPPGRIRTSMTHLEPIFSNMGVEIRHHRVPLYNALYRFDDQMLVTPYLYKLHGYQHPLLHLKRLGRPGSSSRTHSSLKPYGLMRGQYSRMPYHCHEDSK